MYGRACRDGRDTKVVGETPESLLLSVDVDRDRGAAADGAHEERAPCRETR
jgi:hypothetical protein